MADLGSKMMRFVKGKMMRHLPQMITCMEFEDFIVDYLENRLEPSRRRRFEWHRSMCRECREYLEAYQRTRALGRKSMLGAEPDLPDVPEDLVTAILAAKNGS